MPRKSSSGWAALFGRVAVKQVIFDLLTGDLFFHKRFRDAFTSAGFEVRWVEKFWFHNIFEVRLRRKSAVLDKSDLRAARQVRLLLKQAGLFVPDDSIQIIQRSQTVRVVLIFPFGAAGVLRWE